MTPDLLGGVASALVLASFGMRDMRALRRTAIASNLAFVAYAAWAGILPVLVLHLLLLPMNLLRLRQSANPASEGCAACPATRAQRVFTGADRSQGASGRNPSEMQGTRS
jgi:hypothetical protein